MAGKKQSPRELIARTTRPAVEGTNYKKVQLPPGPGEIERFTLRPQVTPADQIKAYIAKITKFLVAASEPEQSKLRKTKHPKPQKTVVRLRSGESREFMIPQRPDPQLLDRAAAARYAIRSLATVQTYLSQLDKCADLQSTRFYAYEAVLTALHFASEFHEWTVIDNEGPIADRLKSIREGGKGAKAKAKKFEPRNIRMAQEFRRRRAKGSKKSDRSDSALKADIGKERENLKPRQAIDAINKGLKVLCGDGGKPHE
jgi:hypothetical protein